MSSLRQVRVGSMYTLPPPAGGIDPSAVASEDEWRDVVCRAATLQASERAPDMRPTLAAGCLRAFRGVSPSLVQQLCSLASIPAEADPAALTGEQWAALHAQWQRWLERVASGSFGACRVPGSTAYSVLGACQQPEASVLEMLQAIYSAAAAGRQFEATQQRLRKCVSNAQVRLAKKIESLQKQGGAADKHLQTQRLADMLLANAHRCGRGAGGLCVGGGRGGCDWQGRCACPGHARKCITLCLVCAQG